MSGWVAGGGGGGAGDGSGGQGMPGRASVTWHRPGMESPQDMAMEIAGTHENGADICTLVSVGPESAVTKGLQQTPWNVFAKEIYIVQIIPGYSSGTILMTSSQCLWISSIMEMTGRTWCVAMVWRWWRCMET